MPVNSSSIPALVTAAKVRRRRRKRRASGGGIFDWSGVSEALPEDIGKERIPDPIYHVAKGALWDLPHRAIDAAKGTSYGLRREDFTDVPPDYSPDPNSPLGSIGVAVPKGAWQPTDELIGASLETAANMAGASAPFIQKNAVGVFGGRLAKTADQEALMRAEKMQAAGAPKEDIWNQTGWFQGADGHWRFEIPDDKSGFRRIHGRGTIDNYPISSPKETSVGEAFQHPELYAAYPDLERVNLHFSPLSDSRGYYRQPGRETPGDLIPPPAEQIGINTPPDRYGENMLQTRSTMLHELQHAIQQREGFSRGASPNEFARTKGAAEAEIERVNSQLRDLVRKMDAATGPEKQALKANYDDLMQYKLQKLVPDAQIDPMEAYRGVAGEVEARNVQMRQPMSPEKRREIPPWVSQDTPSEKQFVRFGNSNDRLAEVDAILEAEKRLTGATNEPAHISAAERAAVPGEPAAALDPGAVGSGGGGPSGVRSLPEAQAAAARWANGRPTLEGQQGPLKIGEDYFVPGPIGKIHDVAEDYMRTVHPDRPYTPTTKYHPIDPEHSKAIAQAYEDMKHTPNDPATKASYDALIDETAKQYQAIKATGLKIEPIPAGMPDPYAANPRLAARDVAENNHLWFFPTEGGFGTVNKITDNPMLRKTGEKIGDHELLANDMFRVVHDYFGHLKEGHGFRAAGEDNAWRTHAQMYSDLARPAMTTETRGQNSWVNYGPHGEKNRTASGADTVYADQKVGLMPEWTMRDRGSPDPIIAYHGSPYSFDRFSMDKIGAGEGNQAYGHGLYFAGHSPVSEFYRYQLAARRDPLLQKYGLDTQDGANVGIELAAAKGDPAPVIESYRKYVDDLRAEGRKDLATRNMIQRAENKIAYLSDPERANGHMYEVAIDARPEQFLDWDKPLAAQGEVGKRMLEIPEVAKQQEHQTKFLGPDKGLTGQSAYAAATKWKRGAELSPSADATSRVTEALKKAGVAGIKYLDQFSRGMGGTHNYVAFDDNMVKILRKYGIVGIPAAGVLGVDGEERRAAGGAVNAALEVARKIKRKKGGRVHIGPIVGDTGGRADKVPMKVPDGAYVIPADIVSGLGEGNTGAGMVQLSKMFPKSKPSIMRDSPGAVPILAADGEFVISPDSIKDRWEDLDYGHRALDAWVLHERENLIKTLEGLDGPAQD